MLLSPFSCADGAAPYGELLMKRDTELRSELEAYVWEARLPGLTCMLLENK